MVNVTTTATDRRWVGISFEFDKTNHYLPRLEIGVWWTIVLLGS